MEAIILVGRLLLAAILGVAAYGKFADLPGSRKAMLNFGVPASIAPALGLLLPIVEAIVAVMLLIAPVAWWGALFALLLFLAFIGGISLNLARGKTPDCHCFGQLHSEPIGWPTLARNGVFAFIALWLVWQGPSTVAASGIDGVAETPAMTWIALIVALIALGIAALEGWFLINLLQQNGRLLLRIESLEVQAGKRDKPAPTSREDGLPIGSVAPAFTLSGLHGETLTLDSLRAAQKPLLLLFLDAQCGPCNALLPEIAKWQREHVAKLTLVPISRGKAEVKKATDLGLQTMLLQKDFEVAQSYLVEVTPSAVLVGADGTIASPVVAGEEDIQSLLRGVLGATGESLPKMLPAAKGTGTANGDCNCGKSNGDCNCGKANGNENRNGSRTRPTRPAVPAVGTVAPGFALADINGNLLDLASFKGHPTLLIFWNPACGYCQQMLADLKEWELSRPESAPRALLISSGSTEANQAMQLLSPIVLDDDFAVGQAYSALGTPTAILVDAEGRIASGLAEGREQLLSLASRQEPRIDQIAM